MQPADTDDLIALARAYVDASNAHDIDRIRPMFRDDANYTSARTGTFAGLDDILDMMTGFFAGHDDAAWRTSDWRELGEGAVEFRFVLTAGGVERPGTERVFFDSANRIRRIEVET